MFMKHSIMTRIYAETLINQAVDSFASSCFLESRLNAMETSRVREWKYPECYGNMECSGIKISWKL